MTDINKSNEYFRETLLKTVSGAVFMVHRNNQIIFWNKSVEQPTQYSANEVIGNTCNKLRMNICANQNRMRIENGVNDEKRLAQE